MSWTLGPFTKVDSANPIMGPQSSNFYCPVRQQIVHWEEKDVFNPCAVVRNNQVYLFYRAEDYVGRYKGTSRIGLALSADGLHFERHGSPVLYPDHDFMYELEQEGGCEDPRIVEDETGTYYMTYTAYNGKAIWLCLATSTDLLHWQKRGVIANIGEAFFEESGQGMKAGTIVSRRVGDKLIATRINGKYYMYWGARTLRVAVSSDLLHWERVLDTTGQDVRVLEPRSERYCYTDNMEVEAGPAAMLTEGGILVFYNGIHNALPPEERVFTEAGPRRGNTWVGVQALFDKDDPTKLLQRADIPFIKPDKEYEITGQINSVTFIEGLVPFQDQWFLYYGTADSKIAVAVCPLGVGNHKAQEVNSK